MVHNECPFWKNFYRGLLSHAARDMKVPASWPDHMMGFLLRRRREGAIATIALAGERLRRARVPQVHTYVTNAFTIGNIDELWHWSSHLGSTLLSQYADLNTKFTEHLAARLNLYNIRWCKARANRFLLVQCLVCNGAVYGKYPYGYNNHASSSIAAIADFMGHDVNDLVNSA